MLMSKSKMLISGLARRLNKSAVGPAKVESRMTSAVSDPKSSVPLANGSLRAYAGRDSVFFCILSISR